MAEHEATKPLLNGITYDTLNNVVKLGLPGLGTLYFAIATIWNLPYAEQIVGTLAALAVFFGIILQLSKRSYDASGTKYDGALTVDSSDPAKDVYGLEVHIPFEDLQNKKEITLKVQNPS